MHCDFETHQHIGKLILFWELQLMSSVLSKFGVIQSTQLWELDQTKLHLENVTGKLVVSSTQLRIVRFRCSLVQSLITWHPTYFRGVQGQMVKGQGHRVKTSSDCQIFALFYELGSLNLMALSEFWLEARKWHFLYTACAYAIQICPKTAQNDWHDVGRPSKPVTMHCNSHLF